MPRADRRPAGRTRWVGGACRLRRSTVVLVSVAIVVQVACGKKGPPLAPFLLVPSPMSDLLVQRVGDEVLVAFTLPTQNQDGTQPADLERVDIYAMTVQPHLPADRTLDLEEFQKDATLVTSIEVAPPPLPEAEEEPSETEEEPPVDVRPRQGFPVSFSEAITAALLVPVDPWEEERSRRERDEAREKEDAGPQKPVKVPLMTPQLPGPLERRYAVVGVSTDEHGSEPALRIAVPLVTPPFAPPAPVVTYDEEVATVAWEPPVGVRESVQLSPTLGAGPLTGLAVPVAPGTLPAGAAPGSPAASDVPPPIVPPLDLVPGTTPEPVAPSPLAPGTAPEPVVSLPLAPGVGPAPGTPVAAGAAPATSGGLGPTTPAPAAPPPLPPLASTPIVEWPPASRYELYEVVDATDGAVQMPRPLNLLPLTVTTYPDKRVEFGVERCFAVVTLDVVAGLDIRSPLSAATCVTFLDTFAPVAPSGLNGVGTDGAVSLSWQPNEEDDLVGYLVLRGVAPGETLLPLTAEPVRESAYLDDTAAPGVQYVYAVQAVDNAVPPNVSLASETVNATAR